MKKSDNYLFFDFVKLTAAIPGFIWLRPRYRYISPAAKKRIKGGALIVSNHIGLTDPVGLQFAVWYRRQHFITRTDIYNHAKWLFGQFHCIPIDTEEFGMEAFRTITEHLKSGKIVTMFPEGHVNDGSGEMQTFKSGMVLIAARAQVPIVPVYVLPKKHFYSRMVFAFGEPVDVCAICGKRPGLEQIEEMTELIREKTLELEEFAKS